MLAFPPVRTNRRRQRPPLLMAIMCLLASTSALISSSSQVEAEMTAIVPSIHRSMDDARTALLGSESDRGQMRFYAASTR